MSLRFQADADFNHKIIAGLRRVEPAIDLQTSDEAMLRGRPDPEVLAYCADADRLLLTHDGRKCRVISVRLSKNTSLRA